MSTNPTNTPTSREPASEAAATTQFGSLKRAARGAVVAGAIAGLSLSAIPTVARAGGPGAGAAIGLGVLGGALAGAAIASTAPVYAAPSPYYSYPNGYWAPAPGYYYYYYPAPQPYYGAPPTTDPQANIGYSYTH
jgi:hypothetical protein